MGESEISADFPFDVHRVEVADNVEMAYIDTDRTKALQGHPPIVFLHGNPSYSYLWRNIIPHVSSKARCVALDLAGFGFSQKLSPEAYGFENNVRYLDSFFSKVLAPGEKVVLVLHDFGSLFGFNWARQHPERVAGLVFMEFHPPMPSWKDTGKMSDELLQGLGGPPEQVHKSIIDDNIFIELFIQDQVVRTLSQKEMDHYRKPFLEPSTRESMREIAKIFPVAGNPPNVYEAVEKYHSWLLANDIPKLFFWADPGKIITPKLAKWYSDNLKNTKSVAVGEAKHYLQEDSPHLIGKEMGKWLENTALASGSKA